ncbi:MAG: nicotinate-nucleotide adenylyltransferase [Saprospiraceae bacterium]|nr:nicotinate-nucleotide adenylyltransferase [Saprospiraceae bacterium]
MRIGLFFGSFNPIHTGHLIIAQHLLNITNLEKIWLVVSPHNPFKEKSSLARDHDRFYLAQIAVEDNPQISVSNIEFSLPQPSYTIDTLTHLKEKYPSHQFSLIMGADNLVSLPKWKNYSLILEKHQIYVYQRSGSSIIDSTLRDHPSITITDAPLLDLSSTLIRSLLKAGKSVRYMVPEKVFEELQLTQLYR